MSDIHLPHPNPTIAVEVVAAFGDSVVGVKHVTDPRAGRASTATRALLLGGACALVCALAGFAYAAKIAGDDAARKDALMAAGRPEWYFRPHQLPRAADIAFALATSLGLGAVAWGLSRRRDERRDPHVRIGTDGGVDFAAPASPATSFDLVAPDASGDGFVLRTAGAMTTEGGAGATGAIAAETPIVLGSHARVRCGAMTFHVSGVAAPARQPQPLLASLDRRVASYFAGSLAAHAAILMLLRAIPPDASSTTANTDPNELANMQLIAISNEMKPPTPTDGESEGETSNTEGTGASMQLAGTQGTPDTHSENPARIKVASETRAEAIEQARRAGVLTAWNGDQLAEITGGDDINQGMDNVDVAGSYDGSPDGYGAPEGTFGHGHRGVGTGGDIVVAGDYHTIPGGRPGGDEFHIGGGGHCAVGHACKGHDPVAPPVKIGEPINVPDEFRAIIQRYIKRNRDRIGYCYEKELLGKPELEGTVNATFVVAASGAVLSSSADGVDPAVSACIADVIHHIEFPQLSDSGSFQILYPFVLHKPNG